MTKNRSTKRALLMSALALLMCVSMLIGSTFAWFTDSVTSGLNKIQSGNLDVKLEHSYGYYDGPLEEVNSETELFKHNVDGKEILWEPGVSMVEYFTVTNTGNLALKFKFNLIADNATETEDGKTLLDVLRVEAMQSSTNAEHLKRLNSTHIPDPTVHTPYELNDFGYETYLLPEEHVVFAVHVMWEPTDHDNDYNVPDGLQLDLGVMLVATQYTYESDSMDDQYDKDAEYPVLPDVWDGTVDTSWFDAGKTEFTISNGAQLAGMAKLGNQLGGKTITLDSDIDLGGKNWTPINIFAPEQSFTFDGGNHTIYNLNVTGRSDGGLFDNSVGTIKNLKLSDAQIESGGRSAILAGRHYGDIINCHVKDSTIEDSYWAVGGIVGQLNSGNIRNCSVTNVNVKSNGGVGGIVGVLNETSGTRTIENCSVIGGTIENIGSYGSSYSGGGIVGMINISNSTVNITGCNSTATLKGEYIFEICPPADDDITLNIN